jgi:hypothetical protein
MPLTKSERRLRGQAAAHRGWAMETDRRGRTQPGRDARDAGINKRTIEAIGQDAWAAMSPEDQAKALASGRRAYFKGLALQASKQRRARRLVADANARAAVEAVGA